MALVKDMCRCVRSKNAGPFWTTIEIFCEDRENYDKLKNAPEMSKENIAELYGADKSAVKRFCMDELMVLKYSYPRPFPSGYRYENDMHSGQQYVKLAGLQIS